MGRGGGIDGNEIWDKSDTTHQWSIILLQQINSSQKKCQMT